MKLLSNHMIFTSPQNLCATSFGILPCMATQNFFSTIPLLTFLAFAFTMVSLLLLCNLNFTSSTPLSWHAFRYQTGMQVFYITPASSFWFIVVSSVFQLFSSLDRFSPIPTMSTKFHYHLQAWIHSTPVPRLQTLSPCFGGTTCHGFDHRMTCHPPWLPQPTPSFVTLLFMGWTCWMHTRHFWFTWLLF